MLFFDPLYLLFVAPAFLLAMIAQLWVKSAIKRYSRVRSTAGLTGAEAARLILRHSGIHDVRVERVSGFLSDHYDPSKRVLRLSPQNHDSVSVAAVGIAAHEAGHAIQHAKSYGPLIFRQTLAPLAMFGSNFAWILLFIGIFLQAAGLVYAGIGLFGAAVLFSLVTLPVEFDASRRAKQLLPQMGIIERGAETRGVSAVLNAAAMTYVAAAATAIAQLLYFLVRAGLLGGSDD